MGFKFKTQNQSGFTLVELLIVVAIIIILATVSVVAFNGIRRNAEISAVEIDTTNIIKYAEVQRINSGLYPDSLEDFTLSSGRTYQYTVIDGGASYCVTITGDGVIRHSRAGGAAEEGPCDEHVDEEDEEPLDPIVSDGLIAWWPFNGDALDYSGNDYDGTPVGGPTFIMGADGTLNGAYDFDGIDDYIALGDILNNQAMSITLSAWVYSKSSAIDRPIFITDNETNYYGYRFMITTNSQTYSQYGSGGGTGATRRRSGFSPVSSVPLNSWIYVAIVVNGAANQPSYINGSPQIMTYSGTGAAPNWSASQATIGYLYNSPSQQYYANLRLDDVRLYNRALTPTEISTLYSAGAK